MPRNQAFVSQAHEPFRADKNLELQHDRVTGPFSFLNPTRASFQHTPSEVLGGPDDLHKPKDDSPGRNKERPASNVEFKWRSRDNRKGRHALVVDQSSDPSAKYLVPRKTSDTRAVLQGIGRMFTYFPYWDVSFLVATIFTLGSAIWVLNAFFEYLPLAQPGSIFHNEILVGGGVTAFIGATVFEVGSLLLIIEVRCC